MNNLPEQYGILMGCPFNSSGVGDCTLNNNTSYRLFGVSANGFTADYLAHNPSTGQFDFVNGKGVNNFLIPLINGSTVSGSADVPVQVGWVTCTQANCASSATTLYTAPAADALYKPMCLLLVRRLLQQPLER